MCSETGQLDGENGSVIDNCLMEIESLAVPKLDFSMARDGSQERRIKDIARLDKYKSFDTEKRMAKSKQGAKEVAEESKGKFAEITIKPMQAANSILMGGS